MTREEFESILEEAFIEGYNDAMEEIFEEESSFDLEEEMDSYNESSKNVRNQMKKYREINKDGSVYYRNGIETDMHGNKYANTHPKAINRGLNWASKTDLLTNKDYRIPKNSGDSEYIGDGKSSTPIGRIKSYSRDDEVFKNYRLRDHVKKNAKLVATRKAREIAKNNLERANKPGIFKNKGNKY